MNTEQMSAELTLSGIVVPVYHRSTCRGAHVTEILRQAYMFIYNDNRKCFLAQTILPSQTATKHSQVDRYSCTHGNQKDVSHVGRKYSCN